MLRDEILAEWQQPQPLQQQQQPSQQQQPQQLSLHVYCHVSGEELWPAPPQLRSFIFQREMALVLDTIAHAEGRELGGLLAAAPVLLSASRALALIPDDDDEELIEKARSNRKSRLASERVAEQKFSRTANGVGECTHCCRVLRACRAAKTASQPS